MKRFLYAGVGILIAAGAVVSVVAVRKISGSDPNKIAYRGQTPMRVPEAYLKVQGPEQAGITLVEYSDFQCPACQSAEPALKEILAKYPEDVKLIFRHYPLSGHLWSGLAHQAAECALRQRKFWEYHDKLFGTQKDWSGPVQPTETFLKFAKELGLDLDAFAACLADPAVTETVNAEKKMGDDLQVRSTPTLFINGERLVGPVEIKVKAEVMVRKILGLPPLPVESPSPAPVPASQPPPLLSSPPSGGEEKGEGAPLGSK